MAAKKKTAAKGRKSTRKASSKSASRSAAAKAPARSPSKAASKATPKAAKPRAKTAKTKPKAAPRARSTKPARKKAARTQRPAAAAARPAAAKPEPSPDAALEALAERIVQLTREDTVLENLTELYHERCVSREVDGSISRGHEELRRKDQSWRSMVERSAFSPRTILAKNGTIVIEWEGEIALRDGREFSVSEVAIHEVKDGRILKERYFYDPGPFAPQPEEPPPPPEPLPEVSPPRGTPPLDPLDL